MAKQGQNEGVRVLDDFVCEAIQDAAVPRADERHQGRNEGMRVVEELVFEIVAERSKQKDAESERPASPIHLNPSITRIAEELAALVACQPDPVGVMALFQKQVISQINTIQGAAKTSLKQNGSIQD
jgi:hypothetical protein